MRHLFTTYLEINFQNANTDQYNIITPKCHANVMNKIKEISRIFRTIASLELKWYDIAVCLLICYRPVLPWPN